MRRDVATTGLIEVWIGQTERRIWFLDWRRRVPFAGVVTRGCSNTIALSRVTSILCSRAGAPPGLCIFFALSEQRHSFPH